MSITVHKFAHHLYGWHKTSRKLQGNIIIPTIIDLKTQVESTTIVAMATVNNTR